MISLGLNAFVLALRWISFGTRKPSFLISSLMYCSFLSISSHRFTSATNFLWNKLIPPFSWKAHIQVSHKIHAVTFDTYVSELYDAGFSQFGECHKGRLEWQENLDQFHFFAPKHSPNSSEFPVTSASERRGKFFTVNTLKERFRNVTNVSLLTIALISQKDRKFWANIKPRHVPWVLTLRFCHIKSDWNGTAGAYFKHNAKTTQIHREFLLKIIFLSSSTVVIV